jgi:hypothetical protein
MDRQRWGHRLLCMLRSSITNQPQLLLFPGAISAHIDKTIVITNMCQVRLLMLAVCLAILATGGDCLPGTCTCSSTGVPFRDYGVVVHANNSMQTVVPSIILTCPRAATPSYERCTENFYLNTWNQKRYGPMVICLGGSVTFRWRGGPHGVFQIPDMQCPSNFTGQEGEAYKFLAATAVGGEFLWKLPEKEGTYWATSQAGVSGNCEDAVLCAAASCAQNRRGHGVGSRSSLPHTLHCTVCENFRCFSVHCRTTVRRVGLIPIHVWECSLEK